MCSIICRLATLKAVCILAWCTVKTSRGPHISLSGTAWPYVSIEIESANAGSCVQYDLVRSVKGRVALRGGIALGVSLESDTFVAVARWRTLLDPYKITFGAPSLDGAGCELNEFGLRSDRRYQFKVCPVARPNGPYFPQLCVHFRNPATG